MKHTIVFLTFLSVFNCNTDSTSGFKIQIDSSNSSISIGNENTGQLALITLSLSKLLISDSVKPSSNRTDWVC